MKIFIVLRYGVNIRQFCGAFTALDLAKTAIDKYILKEIDTHHRYKIIPADTDIVYQQIDSENLTEHASILMPDSVYEKHLTE